MMNNISTKFQTLRELHNYKQDYVASVLGITQSGYAKIENGDIGNVSLKYLQKLAELYQLNLEQLLGWDGKISFGTINNHQGVVVNQGTTHLHTPADERIRELEDKVEKLLELVSK
jgi:transcriptional regulator with XRE-family HTH domain